MSFPQGIFLLTWISFILLSRGSTSTDIRQTAKLVASDAAESAQFGSAVAALNTSTSVLVGAQGDDSANTNAGAVYVFSAAAGGGSWAQAAALTASDAAGEDQLGASVAYISDTAVAGAPGVSMGAGAIYVFSYSTTWTQYWRATATDGSMGDALGASAAALGAGGAQWVVVGAYGDEISTGAVYVFTGVSNTWIYFVEAKLTASDGEAGDYLGISVGRYGGSAAVAGASNATGGGAAYVFTYADSTWAQSEKLTASDAESGDAFGTSVAGLSASEILVGAYNADSYQGAAYVFSQGWTGNSGKSTWSQAARLAASDGAAGDYFGASVAALSSSVALVTASPCNSSSTSENGTAYLFTSSAGSWAQAAELRASGGAASDCFGCSAAGAAQGGGWAAIGSIFDDDGGDNSGSAYIFSSTSTEAPTLAPTEAPTLAPTSTPTLAPTEAPTLAPTEAPTSIDVLAPPFYDDFCEDNGYWSLGMGGGELQSDYCRYYVDGSERSQIWLGDYAGVNLHNWTNYRVDFQMEVNNTLACKTLGLNFRTQEIYDDDADTNGISYIAQQVWKDSSLVTRIRRYDGDKIGSGVDTLASSDCFSSRTDGPMNASVVINGSTTEFNITISSGETCSVSTQDNTYSWGTVGFFTYYCAAYLNFVNVTILSEGSTGTPTPTMAPTLTPTMAPTSIDAITVPFFDDFCEDQGYWTATAKGTWSFTHGDRDCVYANWESAEDSAAWIGDYAGVDLAAWTNYTVEWQMNVSLACQGYTGLLARAQSAMTSDKEGRQYYFTQSWDPSSLKTRIYKYDEGSESKLAQKNGFSGRVNGLINCTATVNGRNLEFTVTLSNGENQTVTAVDDDDDYYSWGVVGFKTYECPTIFNYIKVTNITASTSTPTFAPTVAPTLTPTLAPTKAPIVGTLSPTITPVDPPRLTSAKFSSTGGIVNIYLDSDSDRGSEAGLSATFSCSRLLDFEGEASYCSWTADDEVKMILGGDATLVPGSNITMQTGVLRAYCTGSDCSGWDTSPRHTVLASAPVNPVTPTLILSYVSKLGSCSDISVDASGSYGSGGRSMTFEWNLHHPQGSSFSILEAAINAQNTSILEISNDLLSAGSNYNISVEASNFLGTSSKKHILVKLSKRKLPSIQISGGSTATAYRSSALSLFASASASACNGTAGGTLAYNWTSDDDAGLSSTASDPRYFKLPAYSLTAGRTYGFTATVVDSSTGLAASASVTVSVPRGDLTAGIAGGDRTVSNTKDLVLDASTTVDEDLADGLPSPQNVSYLWGCQYTNGTLCQFDVPTGLVVNITQDNLVADETFVFTVFVVDGNRSSNASVSISILGEPLPDVLITTTIPSKVDPSYKLSLSATVTSDYSTTVTSEWAVASDSPSTEFETSSSLEEAASTSLSLSSSMTSSVEVSHTLVITTGELAMGNTYSLQISASYSKSSSAATSKVTINVNMPPTPGSFEVDPESGYSLVDLFSFQASNWVDDSEDLPFQYQFGYVNTESESKVLNSRGTSNKLSDAILPQGSGVTYSTTCFVFVYDIYSSYGEETMQINVLPFNGTVSDLAILAEYLLDTKLSSYDTSGTHGTVVAASSSLDSVNCTLAPNCTELFRENCGFDDDHTCGDCLDGFVGPLDHTSECYTAASTCNNGILDAGEADIDCGGGVCDLCATGSSCTVDTDCEYALCSNSTCAIASKSCSNDCFGNGVCIHESTFGDLISAEECLVDTGSYCSAVCNCTAGFYGDDCSYTNATWAQRMYIRQAMLDYGFEAYDFTDIDSDSMSVASHSLNSVLGGAGELSAAGLTSVANYTATLASSLAGLDSTGTSAASLTACLDSLISSGSLTDGNSFDAVSGAASTVASSLYSDLVAGEDATSVTSDDMAMTAAKYNLAGGGGMSLSVPQTDNQASVGGGQTSIALSGNSTDLFTGLGDLSLSVASFSTNIYAAADSTENDTTSGIVRLSLSTADAASGSFQVELTLQNYEEQEYILSNTTTYSVNCTEGTNSSHVFPCNGANTTLTCAGEEETLAFNCTSAGTVPRCIIRNGDVWDSESCEVVWYNSTTTHCLCTFEFDEGRRLSDDDSSGFASGDVSSNVAAIGGQLADNLSGFATPFTDPSVILENLGVFVTMGCVVGGVPFLAWFTSYLGRLWERKGTRVKQQIAKKKTMIMDSKYTRRFRKGKSHLDNPSQIDYNEFKKIWGSVVPNLKLGHVLYEKFSQSLISQHPWVKSFHISTPGWGKQQAVAISLVYCTTLMFWDATLYPLLHPSSAICSDSSMSSESDCESYGCTWDSDSGSCSAEEVDDSLESTVYLVIYSMVLTLPPCILVNKVVSKCIGIKPGENNKVEWQIENVNRGDSTWEFGDGSPTRAATSAHKAFQRMESDELGVEERSVSMFSQASSDPSAPSGLDASQQGLLNRGSGDGSLQRNSFSRLFPRPGSTSQAPVSKDRSSGPKNVEDVLAKMKNWKDGDGKRILTPLHAIKPGLDKSWEKNQMESISVTGETLDEETLQMQSLVKRLSSFRGKIDDEAALSHDEKVAKRVEEELEHLEKNSRIKPGMRIAKTIRQQVIIALAHEPELNKLNAFERNEYLTKLAVNDTHSIVAKVAVRKVNVNEEKESAIWDDDPDKVLKKPLIPPRVKQVAGTTFVVLYCLFCAYYVCLFGINYGSTYTNAWMKTFFLGFIQSLAVTRPLKVAAIFFLCTRFVPQKLDIEELKAIQHYAAAAQLARRYPNLEISKIIIQKDYFPPGYDDQEVHKTKEKIERIWKRYCTFENILTYMVLAVGFTLLMLPDDLQDVITEGGICVAFNYILVACGAGKLNSDFALYLLIFIIVPLVALTIYYARKLWRKVRESETFTKFTEMLES